MIVGDLIDRTRAAVEDGQPLELLSSAVAQQQELAEQGEQLRDRFVQEARSEGCSCAQIGEVLGVSRQAIQQRHSSRPRVLARLKKALGGTFTKLISRFTRNARQALLAAQEEARALQYECIGPEHLLLGVLAHGLGRGTHTLVQFGVDLDAARARVREAGAQSAKPRGSANLPFHLEAKKAFEQSLHEAELLGDNFIGTEHIVLAILAQRSRPAIGVLAEQDVQPERLRTALLHELGEKR